MIRRSESTFAAASGRVLFRRSWLTERVDRVIVLLHGFAEHSGRYDHLGAWFAERGCAVHAYDQQGHGESPGRRGHATSFAGLIDDLEAFVVRVREEHRDVPLTVLGHSMGGLVSVGYACQRKPEQAGVAAIATSAAALALAPNMSRMKIAAAKLFSRVLPRFAMDPGLELEGLSRDPAVLDAYLADPLVISEMTTTLAVEIIGMIDRLRSAGGGAQVSLPMLLLHGEADPISPADGSREFFSELRSEGSDLRIYPELRHEIFNEPERESIYTDLLDWLLAREAAEG